MTFKKRIRLTPPIAGGEAWYPDRDLKEKIKVETTKFFKLLLFFQVHEFLDFWQSTANPAAVGLFKNALMYKLFFKLKQPNIKVNQKNTKSPIKHI